MKKIRVFAYDIDRNNQLINGTLYWSKVVSDDAWLLHSREFQDEILGLNRLYENDKRFRYFVHVVL